MKPKQRVSKAVKETTEWKHENVRYFYDNCTQSNLSKAEITRLYRLAAGHLDEEEYMYATDPLGASKRKELSGSPAGRIKNMDIISPILMRLMGEKTQRPNQYVVYAKNSDFPSEKSKRQFELWQKNLHVMFVNEMINLGQYVPGMTDEQGQPIEEPRSPEEIQMELSNMSDWMAIQGQEALDYISSYNELSRNFRKGFYDWLVTNSVFSYRDVRYDDTVYEIKHPGNISWLKGESIDFLEDADAVKCTEYMSINQVVDNFRDLDGMTEEIINDLDSYGRGYRDGNTQRMFSATEVFYSRVFGNNGYTSTNGDSIEVCHIQWKSFQLVKRVSGTNILGQSYEYEYDEDYVALEGETVKEVWMSVPYEGYILGGKHIVGVQQLPIPRTSMNNESKCKLYYNGRIFHSRDAKAKSPVQKLEFYQKKYNICYHFFEKVMNKNKDQITILPLGLIPDKPGWDELTALYYADATGFLFVDDSDPRSMQSLQYVKTLDMGLNNYIQFVYQMLAQIKQDGEEVVGINRQRKGDSMASDAVTNNVSALSRSVITTEELFVEYDEFEEKDLQALMDLSKYAFVKGKKASYISSDGKQKYLDVNPESYPNIDFGVFVRNGGKESKRLDEFKQSAFAFAQNQMSPSLVGKVINSDNLEKLILEMEEAEQKLQQMQSEAQEAESQQAQAEISLKAQEHDDKMALDYYKIEMDNATKREIALSGSSPTGGQTERSIKEIALMRDRLERDKAVIQANTEKYKADKQIEAAKISAKNKGNKS